MWTVTGYGPRVSIVALVDGLTPYSNLFSIHARRLNKTRTKEKMSP